MRVLGLDPGLQHTGWGVVDVDGHRLLAVACGVVSAAVVPSLAERLAVLFRGVSAVMEQHQPHEAAVEETFLNKNPSSTLKLGHARAVALLVPALAGLDVAEYSTKLVKKAVVGTGTASKEQVALMVQRLLPGMSGKAGDASDALAVAICHAHHRQTQAALGARAR